MSMRIFSVLILMNSLMSAAGAPQILIQTGHSGAVKSLQITPDDRYLVSSGDDGRLILWSLEFGKMVRILNEGTLKLRELKMSPDGRSLFYVRNRNTIEQVELMTGNPVRTFMDPQSVKQSLNIRGLNMSPDGKFLYGLTHEGLLLKWDMESGTLTERIPVFQQTDLDTMNQEKMPLAVSPDGQWIAFSPQEVVGDYPKSPKGLILFSLADRKVSFKMNLSAPLEDLGFSADSRYLLLMDSNYSAGILDLKEMKTVTLEGRFSRYFNLACPSGRDPLWITLMNNDQIVLRSLPDGKPLGSWRHTSQDYTNSFLFSPSGKIFAAGDGKGKITVYRLTSDMKSAFLDKVLTGQSGILESMAVSQDGSLAAVSVGDNGVNGVRTLMVWNLLQGELKLAIPAHTAEVESMAILPGQHLLLSCSRDSSVKLWDLKTGRLIRSLLTKTTLTSLSLSPDGKEFAVSGFSSEISIYRVSDFKKVNSFSTDQDKNLRITYTQDGKAIVCGSAWGQVVTKYVIQGAGSRKLGKQEMLYVRTDPVSGKITANDGLKHPCLLDPSTGKVIQEFKESGGSFSFAALSQDGRMFAASDYGGSVFIWNAETGKLEQRFPAHLGGISDLVFLKDGRILSIGNDGFLRISDPSTGRYVKMTTDKSGSKWLVFNQDQYWHGSWNCSELVLMKDEESFYSIDQFALWNNRPDRVLEDLVPGNQTLIRYYREKIQRKLKKAGFQDQKETVFHVPRVSILQKSLKGRELSLTMEFRDTERNLKRYQVYVNHVPVYGDEGRMPGSKESIVRKNGLSVWKASDRIILNTGLNKIEVGVFNDQGTESYRSLIYETVPDQVQGNLYYLGFGVSSYRNPDLNLQFAHKDAMDLEAVFKKQNGFSGVITKLYTDARCTRESFKEALSWVSQIRPEDTLILFIAGHGVHDLDPAATYYFLVHDTDLNRLSSTAVEFEQIENLLYQCRSRNKLFLMDTCESGEIDPDYREVSVTMVTNSRSVKSRSISISGALQSEKNDSQTVLREFLFNRSRYIDQDTARRSGSIVFSSCRGGEYSYEDEALENGLFTEEILRAFSGAADSNRDGMLSMDELKSFVMNEVKRASEGLQNPTVDRDNLFQALAFPLK